MVICAVFVRVGAQGGYYHGSSWRSRRAQRKRPRHPSSLHDLDLFPARRFHEGPTPTRSTHTTLPQDPQDSKDSRPQESTPNMIPLIPTLALAFVSFICSAFVILRILIPILPPHPLSRRVRPVSSHYPPILPPDQLTALTLTVRIWSSQLQDSFPRRQKPHLARMLRYFGIGNLRMASRCRAPWRSHWVRGRF